MSRCFPFPPPGYERKHILEDLLVLKEAKHKEKKEKRKRRDKEKRKDREKKEKDGKGEKVHGDKKGKHREKKERRRDKNKDENKGKEKENSDISCLEKSTVATNHPDGSNSLSVEKCSIMSQSHNGLKTFDHLMEAEFVQELNKRVREDAKISRNHFSERAIGNSSNDTTRENVEVERTLRVVDDKEIGNRDVKILGKRSDIKMEKPEKNKLVEPENVRRMHHFSDTSRINGNLFPYDNGNENAGNESHIKKRKSEGINGFLYDSETRPNKIHPSIQNGSKLIASRAPGKFSDDLSTRDHEGSLINDVLKPQNPPPSRHVAPAHFFAPKSSCSDSSNPKEELNLPTVENLLAEVSKRPPHPDSKFLSHILSVPSVGEWFEYDDQEWLCSKKDPPPKSSHLPEEKTTLAWSKPVHIESADVYALPYVIPY